jgi:hypothetical protein
MYVIKMRDGTYFHKDGKIILFESEQEINEFINCFVQYSVNRLSREGRRQEAMTAPMCIISESVAVPVDFNIDTVECGVVYARDMRR